MQLEVDERAAEALRDMLADYLPDLNGEIGKTEDYDLRAELHRRHEALSGILFQLGGAAASGGAEVLGRRGFLREPR